MRCDDRSMLSLHRYQLIIPYRTQHLVIYDFSVTYTLLTS